MPEQIKDDIGFTVKLTKLIMVHGVVDTNDGYYAVYAP
jgi:hypothetical protein